MVLLLPTTATSLFPSADRATDPKNNVPGTLFDNQVFPEFVETQMTLASMAANFVPSAEQAMQDQLAYVDPC